MTRIASLRFNNALRRRPEDHPDQTALTPAYILDPVRAMLGGIADAIEGDYPDVSLIAHVDSDPAAVWVEATDNDGVTREFRLTVEGQP